MECADTVVSCPHLQVQTLFWVSAPKQLKTALYIFLGWVVLPWVGQMREALGLTVRLMAFLVRF